MESKINVFSTKSKLSLLAFGSEATYPIETEYIWVGLALLKDT